MSYQPPRRRAKQSQGSARLGPRARSAAWPPPSLDDLVGPDEDGLGDREPESLGSPQIDDQIEFRGLLDRQITGLGTFENFVDVKGQALVKQSLVRPIGHEAA